MEIGSRIDLIIDSHKLRLSDKSNSSDITRICNSLIKFINEYAKNSKEFWFSLRQAQSMIETKTGIKDTIRETLIFNCKANGGNEQKLRKDLYSYLPTDEELLLQKQKKESYYISGSKHIGQVIDVKYEKQEVASCISGIKRENASKYTQSNGYFGSNGTYRVGYPDVKLSLFLIIRLRNHPHLKIDVRNKALLLNNRKNITDAFISSLKEQLKNRDVQVEYVGGDKDARLFNITDYSVLKI